MLISLFKYNQTKTEIPTSIYKIGGPIVKLLCYCPVEASSTSNQYFELMEYW